MTNLEWVRTLTAGQLVCEMNHCATCVYYDCCDGDKDCQEGRVAWLNAEHIEPDMWEKVENDARKPCGDYWECDSHKTCNDCESYKRYGTFDCLTTKPLDLVRRCKALAGVGE